MDDAAYKSLVAAFLARESQHEFASRLHKLLQGRRFQNCFSAFARQFGDENPAIFLREITEERHWDITQIIFAENAGRLNQFTTLRDQVEKCLLIGAYEEGEQLLENVHRTQGDNFWYVRSRLRLLGLQGRREDLRRFYEETAARLRSKVDRYIANYLRLIADSETAHVHLRTFVLSVVHEFTEANHHSLAGLFALWFSPAPLSGRYKYAQAIGRFQVFPLIDQYNLTLQLLAITAAESIASGSPAPKHARRFTEQLSSKVNDPVLQRLNEVLRGTLDTQMSDAGKDILRNYEKGRYRDAIKLYEHNLSHLRNPLAYVNLVAKARAFVGNGAEPSANGALRSIIDALTRTYRLEVIPTQAADALTGYVIQLHGSIPSAQLQLALYKAIPNYFPREDVRLAALLALATERDHSPMARILTYTVPERFNRFADQIDPQSPDYRIAKRKIYENVASRHEGHELEQRLQQYKIDAPLRKDYYEAYTDYCLNAGKLDLLIKEAAEALTDNLGSYVCFPMMELASIIQEEQKSSLESVIVAFYYVRARNADDDSVLNEAFENYVLEHHASRPSELLEKVGALTAMDVVFFRDVCVLDVMDFLSCFESPNQLRSERVRIIDLLLEKGVLSADARMAEVEEIIWQGSVEAGATEFNTSKIFVDDQAIHKTLHEDVTSLLELYHSALGGGEGVTLLDEEFGTAGSHLAYLSGSKNAILLRIWNLLRHAFIDDDRFGLDKNLSTEIRHGFFSNLMRARLEERSLLTESDETGKYAENTRWLEANFFARDDVWTRVDGLLQRFSADFNAFIAEAEEWMKIKKSEEKSTRIFAYELPLQEFDRLKVVVEDGADADLVMSRITDLLWSQTEVHLATIRERLNGELRHRADRLFGDLEESITEAKGGAAFRDLMQAITLTRNEVKEDISRVVEWFRRAPRSEISAQSVGQVIEISVTSFEQIKGAAFAISKDFSDALKQKPFPAASAKPLIIAITNLLDNCYRHSGLGRRTHVRIVSRPSTSGWEVSIVNTLSHARRQQLTPDAMLEIEKKAGGAAIPALMRVEGGSGLTKAQNQVAGIGARLALAIDDATNEFSVCVAYDH